MSTVITYDCGNKLLGRAFKNDIFENQYCIRPKYSTLVNPQAKSILQKIHKVVANLISRFDLQNIHPYKENPQEGIISATDFTVYIMYQTTLQYTTGKLMVIYDMILHTPFIAD